MQNLLDQLYKTKLRFAGLVTAVLGVGFLFLSNAAATTPTLRWLVGWPTNELGTTLLSAGVIAVIFEYYARKEADERTDQHLRQAIRQEAPAIRDAVLHSFAFDADTLRGLASPETLDRVAAGALGLRLDDASLAEELYTDLRDQIIQAPERWHDVDISVALSPSDVGPATGKGSMFVATTRWQYRVVPASPTMRLSCVSDLTEYRELLRDPSVASIWYFGPSASLDAGSLEAFELVELYVDGKARPIRRTERNGSQHYTVNLGKAASAGREVTLSYTYRVLVKRHGHVLYLDLPRPTKGLKAKLSYGNAGIYRINTLDFVASAKSSHVEVTPPTVPERAVSVSFDGWIFPRSGVAFVWVLEDEIQPRPPKARKAKG